MSLSSLHLDAFHCVAKTLNFSRAAKELRITQSALTQRIQNLEDELGLTLFVRNPRGVQSTPAGERLLRYCQARSVLEGELVEELKGEKDSGYGGVLRLAGYSTVLRSVILPSLAPFLRANRRVQPFFFDSEMRHLGDSLVRGESDYIVIDQPLKRTDLETIHLGDEENVLVCSKDFAVKDDVDTYLDHDPEDSTTLDYLRLQSGGDATTEAPTMRRGFLDEIYGIMDGVALGLGQAVIPRHLAVRDPRLKIVPGQKPMKVPVHLHFFKQPFYTKMHEEILGALKANAGKLLKG